MKDRKAFVSKYWLNRCKKDIQDWVSNMNKRNPIAAFWPHLRIGFKMLYKLSPPTDDSSGDPPPVVEKQSKGQGNERELQVIRVLM